TRQAGAVSQGAVRVFRCAAEGERMRFAQSIRGKLSALVALWTIPMTIAVGFLVDRSVGQDLRFAEREQAGNAFQRPLLALVASLRRVGLLVAAGPAAHEPHATGAPA